MPTEIATTLITGAFALLIAMIEFGRRQNNKDHNKNAIKLDELVRGHKRIENKVDDLADKHLSHIIDHAKGEI
jgi:hypothetical protein